MPSNSEQSGPNYLADGYIDDDRTIRQRMTEVYQENSSQWLQYFYEGDIDMRMYSGDQEAIYNYIANTYYYYKRNQVNFNKMRTIVNMITGHQARNRKTSVIIPQEPQDQEAADQLSNVLQWSMQNANTYPLISKAFTGSTITGINLISAYLDYTNDPVNGDIKSKVWAYNSFLMDPYFRNADLSDCNYIWTRKWLSKDAVKLLLPGREKEINAMEYNSSRDAKFPYQPENLNYSQRQLLVYDEFWYLDTRMERMLLDTRTGETHKWRGSSEEMERFLASYPEVKEISQRIPTVKYAVVVNDRVLVNGPNPLGIDSYPFSPSLCYFHPEIPYFPQRIQGVIRGLRDAQWSYNRRMRLQLDFLEAGIQRGVKFIEDALVDPADAFMQGTGRGLAIKKGHSLDEVQEMQPPQIPPSWFQEIEKLDSDMLKISGVNEELLGSADDEKAGILSMLRQGAGLTTLQPLFDNLDQTQKHLAKLYISIMQNNWEEGKFERILNEPLNPIIKNKYFSKFDIQIIDGTLTPNQQVMEFHQLMEMMKIGINIPPELLVKSAPLQNKKDLIAAMEAQQKQQAQMQEQTMQIQMQQAMANIENTRAQAAANEGLGVERTARVAENRALAIERIEEAKKDRELADLNKAKALKELTEIDLNQLEKAIKLLQLIRKDAASSGPNIEEEEVVNEELA